MLLRWKQSQSDSVTYNTLRLRAFGEQLYTYIMSNLMLLCLNMPVKDHACCCVVQSSVYTQQCRTLAPSNTPKKNIKVVVSLCLTMYTHTTRHMIKRIQQL